MSRPGTVAIVINPPNGHIPEYAVLYERAFQAAGWRTAILGPDWASMARSGLQNLRAKDAFHHLWYPEKYPSFATTSLAAKKLRLSPWIEVGREVRRIEKQLGEPVTLVFFPWLNPYLDSANLAILHPVLRQLFRYRWTGVLAPSPRRPSRRGLLRREAVYSGRCAGFVVLDESEVPHRADVGYFVAPDPCDLFLSETEPSIVTAIRARARGRKILSLLGNPGKRKNLKLFLELSQHDELRDFFFLVAGSLRGDLDAKTGSLYRHYLEQPADNVGIHPSELEPVEMDGLIELSDVLFLVYQEHSGSSNFLTRAARLETPVVVNRDATVMAERVARYRLGLGIDVSTSPQDLSGLKALLLGTDPIFPKFQEYRNAHSFDRLVDFVRKLTAVLSSSHDFGHSPD